MFKDSTKKIIILSCLGLLALSYLLSGCSSSDAATKQKNKISANSAGLKAVEYVNENVFRKGNNRLELADVEDIGPLYEVQAKVFQNEKELKDYYTIYITKDGEKILIGKMFNADGSPTQAEVKRSIKEIKRSMSKFPKKDKPEIKAFVMSGCPFGVVAQNALSPVIKQLGDNIDFQMNYIVSTPKRYAGNGDKFCLGKYCSMHGKEEVVEDVRQLCIAKEQKDKFWSYLDKFNEKCKIGPSTPQCSKKVAKEAGVDYAKVEACLKKSDELLKKEHELSTKLGVQGSPTIFINGERYNGPRFPNGYLAAICEVFKKAPAECQKKIEGGDAVASSNGGCG